MQNTSQQFSIKRTLKTVKSVVQVAVVSNALRTTECFHVYTWGGAFSQPGYHAGVFPPISSSPSHLWECVGHDMRRRTAGRSSSVSVRETISAQSAYPLAVYTVLSLLTARSCTWSRQRALMESHNGALPSTTRHRR